MRRMISTAKLQQIEDSNGFELGCSGIYSTYNITGLKKNAEISLSIIYNNNGAESLLSSAGLTLTLSDIVTTI